MIALRVNGADMEAAPEGRTSLADMLRDELLLTGTHLGCEHGVCGACTLMLDGEPVRSCLTLAASCAGAEVRTVEGFEDDPLMTALRAAFSRHHALQCGYCTPGMLFTAYDIVRRLPQADEARIRLELSGNLCRCTGYQGIVEAVADVLRDPPVGLVAPVVRAAPPPPALRAPAGGGGAFLPDPPPRAREVSAQPTDGARPGTTLTRTLTVAADADHVWTILHDIETVAKLLPGATLRAREGDIVEGAFTASLGPIRASFAGQATVTYDEAGRSGRVSGAGGDRLTRSNAHGTLAFTVQPAGAACTVALSIAYRLKGPLAQFGRPAVVEGLVDHLLARFAANLEAAVRGQAPNVRPAGVLAALLAMVRRLVRKTT
jgi:carbon-monoxide dehydrogenase small subunit